MLFGVSMGAVIGEAVRSLVSHPLRSSLTAASVAFGAAVLFILMSYATGVPDATTSILRSMGSKEFLVEARRSRGRGGNRGGRQIRIRYSDLDAVREACPSISGLAPAYGPGRGGPVFSQAKSWPWARLTGVGYQYREVTDMSVVEGRWFTKEEEIGATEVALISLPLAEGLYEGAGAIGEVLDAQGRRFEVIGVYESNAQFAYSVTVPYPTAMDMGDTGGRYVSHVAFAPRRPDLAAAAVAEIRSALASLYSFDPSDTSAIDVTENIAFVERVEATSLALQAMVLTIAAIALVLGCLGAANVVGIAVSERMSELGLRRAIGAPARQIRMEVLAETLLLSLSGGIAGVLLGGAAAGALGPLEFTEYTTLVPHPDPQLLAIALPILVLTATIAGLPAARRASRVDPAIALRAE